MTAATAGWYLDSNGNPHHWNGEQWSDPAAAFSAGLSSNPQGLPVSSSETGPIDITAPVAIEPNEHGYSSAEAFTVDEVAQSAATEQARDKRANSAKPGKRIAGRPIKSANVWLLVVSPIALVLGAIATIVLMINSGSGPEAKVRHTVEQVAKSVMEKDCDAYIEHTSTQLRGQDFSCESFDADIVPLFNGLTDLVSEPMSYSFDDTEAVVRYQASYQKPNGDRVTVVSDFFLVQEKGEWLLNQVTRVSE